MSLYSRTFWSDLLEKVRIADAVRNNNDVVERDLQKLLCSKLPGRNIGIHLFGSRIMGVANKNSDLDIFVDIDGSLNEYVTSITYKIQERQILIKNAFASQPNWNHIVNHGGKCPIVKVLYKPLNLECDISFSSGLTVSQNKLVNHIFEMQPIARYMVIFLRGWIKDIGLQEEFRSHVLILMVIFQLQSSNFLPAIEKLQLNLSPSIGSYVTTFNKLYLSHFQMQKIPVTEEETRKMLSRFFEFYATFNFSQYVICPLLGKSLPRFQFSRQMPHRFYTICCSDSSFRFFDTAIQDFIHLNYNKGWLIKTSHATLFQNKCKSSI